MQPHREIGEQVRQPERERGHGADECGGCGRGQWRAAFGLGHDEVPAVGQRSGTGRENRRSGEALFCDRGLDRGFAFAVAGGGREFGDEFSRERGRRGRERKGEDLGPEATAEWRRWRVVREIIEVGVPAERSEELRSSDLRS